MSKIRVSLFNQPRNFGTVEAGATVGGTIGENIYNQDGSVFVPLTEIPESQSSSTGSDFTHTKDASTSRTLVASDDKKIIEFTNAGAITVTMDGNNAYSVGFETVVFCTGGGQVTWLGTNGMVIGSSDSLKTRTQNSPVGIRVEEANQAFLYGDIEPVAPPLSVLVNPNNTSGAPVWLALNDGETVKRVGNTLVSGSFGGANYVEALVDFGSGASDTSVVITGLASITATAKVSAWILAKATVDHSADEHWVETIGVMAGNVVAGVGFTIYAKNTNTLNEPIEPFNRGGRGGKGTLLYGKYTVQASWTP